LNKEYLEKIARDYDLLIPKDKETFLLLISLYNKIKTGEIEQEFSQFDFETTLYDISQLLQRESNIQIENISKKLSQYFYTTLKDPKKPYQLTEYAKEFCELIEEEIEPEYAKLSLKQTFRRNLPLKDEDFKDINSFEHWYFMQFKQSKKVILSHTENLQRYVDNQILELSEILKNEFENAKILLETFIKKFEKIREKADDLTDTLNFKTETIQKIDKAEVKFQDSQDIWEKYISIRNEVLSFFENINKRVLAVNDKIQTSRIKLKSLYQNLQYKQQYKIKLETFLQYLLEKSENIKGEIYLPNNILLKQIPYEHKHFFFIPNINFENIKSKEIPELVIDKEYEKKQREKNKQILDKQESVAKWVNEIDKHLSKNKEIDYSVWFDKIYEKEKRFDIPVEVCYGLIERFNKNNQIEISIDNKKPHILNSEIALWKMKIKVLNS